MVQQKRAQQGQDNKSICILWMDERGEGGMDARNILPRYIHSLRVHVAWRGSETRTKRLGPSKEKENFDGGDGGGGKGAR